MAVYAVSTADFGRFRSFFSRFLIHTTMTTNRLS
nr:MAG TPA: hypothetical protein [Caudoviricetes sp.]